MNSSNDSSNFKERTELLRCSIFVEISDSEMNAIYLMGV